jgi:hypothetical protein
VLGVARLVGGCPASRLVKRILTEEPDIMVHDPETLRGCYSVQVGAERLVNLLALVRRDLCLTTRHTARFVDDEVT